VSHSVLLQVTTVHTGVTECYSYYRVLRYVVEELLIYTSMYHVCTVNLLATHNQKSSARHNICNCRLTKSVSYKICRCIYIYIYIYIYSQSILKGNISLTASHRQINNQQNTQRTGKFIEQATGQATKAQSGSKGIDLLFR